MPRRSVGHRRAGSARRADGSRSPWPIVSLLLGAAVVIAGMLVMADHARMAADRARQAQTVIERVRSQALHLDALTWRSLSSGPEVADSARADGIATFKTVGRDLRTLRRLGVSKTRIARIEEPLGAIYGLGIQASVLARSGDPARSRRIARTSFNRALASFAGRIDAAARDQGRRAHAARARTQQGWLGSLVVGLLLLFLLGWRLHVIQHSAVVADRDREAERRAEQRLRALVRHSSDVAMVIDPAGSVRWVAESVRAMFGYDPEALAGRPVADAVHPEDLHRAVRMLEDAMAHSGPLGTVGLRLLNAGGEYRQIEVIAHNHLDDPDIEGILLNLRDVSDRVALEAQLRHQAFHDGLTGLPNRALFDDRLTQALARVRRRGDGAAVVFVDLDGFKAVNDSLGHAAGDELLRVVGQRLDASLRAQDTAARLGGDEFAVLFEDLADEREALDVAVRMHEALAAPVEVGGRRIMPHASIGVAWPDAAATAETLLGNADVAMYEAKRTGRGGVVAFAPSMRAAVTERLNLTADLDTAVERGEFFLEYQPVVRLATETITSVEALIRWEHPQRGRVAPDQFIAIAESTGHIVAIGQWVLETACAQLRAWSTERPDAAELGMNVNVSTRQLAEPGFSEVVAAALAAHDIAPERLTLEITEYLLLDDSDVMRRQLERLKALGVQLAVDDFGTGYSALSYLGTFPIDVLKIDRSFVSGIDRDPEKAQLVQGIIEIGNNLNLRVVTEGIEQAAEAELLRTISSGYGQGYLFSRPVQPQAILRLLAAPAGEPVILPVEAS